MPDITSVPELRQLLDTKRKVAVNNGECRGCIDLGTVADYACDACSEAAMAFDNALTDATIAAMIAALEAAYEAEPWMDFIYANSLLGADDLEPLKVDGLRLSNALTPLFPKEEDDA